LNDKEINEKLSDIAAPLKMFDLMTHKNEDGTFVVNERQGEAIEKLLELFQALNWQMKFNDYKELKVQAGQAISHGFMNKPGTPVKVRPCDEKFGNKTYFGILIGDVAQSISHSIKDDVVTASFSWFNPAILIPELGEIVYGCESWWGVIKSTEEAEKVITDETVKNCWYVKLLTQVQENKLSPVP